MLITQAGLEKKVVIPNLPCPFKYEATEIRAQDILLSAFYGVSSQTPRRPHKAIPVMTRDSKQPSLMQSTPPMS